MASALVNAAMLKWAREQTPFKSVYEVSKRKPTINPDKLLAWENGTESPSITSAKELATLYKLPLAVFSGCSTRKSIIQYKDTITVWCI